MLAQALGLRGGMKPHRGELKIDAALHIGGREEEEQKPEPGDEQERHRAEVDEDREQRRLDAFEDGGPDRNGGADRIRGVMHALHLLGDGIDEEAGNQRGDRRDRNHPFEDVHRRMGAGSRMDLDPGAAALDERDEPAIDPDAEHDEQHDGERDRPDEQHPERRRRHLGQGLDRRIEHEGSPQTEEIVARIERRAAPRYPGMPSPDYAWLHPGYKRGVYQLAAALLRWLAQAGRPTGAALFGRSSATASRRGERSAQWTFL